MNSKGLFPATRCAENRLRNEADENDTDLMGFRPVILPEGGLESCLRELLVAPNLL